MIDGTPTRARRRNTVECERASENILGRLVVELRERAANPVREFSSFVTA
jgi:hypothetical protein